MKAELQKSKSNLVIDHENLDHITVPNLKRKVGSLRQARALLLEEEFSAIVFLSVLEEANEIETFVKGVRLHPKLANIQIFCEYGLLLALPKDLDLISFEESEVSEDEPEDEINESHDILNSDGELFASISSSDKLSILEEFKKFSAKGIVRLELSGEQVGSKEELFQQYLKLLREEFNS